MQRIERIGGSRPWCVALLSLALSLVGCGGGGTDEGGGSGGGSTFSFATSEEVTIDIEVTNGGTPLTGASVALVEHIAAIDDDDSEANVTETFFEGGTGSDGHCRAEVRIPDAVAEFDVVVQYPGLSGVYTFENLRTEWGEFAPSARIKLDRAASVSFTVALN